MRFVLDRLPGSSFFIGPEVEVKINEVLEDGQIRIIIFAPDGTPIIKDDTRNKQFVIDAIERYRANRPLVLGAIAKESKDKVFAAASAETNLNQEQTAAEAKPPIPVEVVVTDKESLPDRPLKAKIEVLSKKLPRKVAAELAKPKKEKKPKTVSEKPIRELVLKQL